MKPPGDLARPRPSRAPDLPVTHQREASVRGPWDRPTRIVGPLRRSRAERQINPLATNARRPFGDLGVGGIGLARPTDLEKSLASPGVYPTRSIDAPATGEGSYNIFIGNRGVAGDANLIKIGTGLQTKTYVAGIRGVTTGVDDAATVMIDSTGQLGTLSSSRRYKQDIEDMDTASDALLSLRPVTFRYKKEFADGKKPIQFGLIAEQVAAVLPELVVYDEKGRPETVKYHLLSSLLLNELQKLHSRSVEQTQEIEQLRSQANRLVAVEARMRELEPLAARLERLEALLTEAPRLTAGDRRPTPDERPGAR